MTENRYRDEFKRRELDYELRNEPPNNIQIVINGKPWKVFAGRGRPDSAEEYNNLRKMQNWAASKSQATGKKWEVYLTGAPPTTEGSRQDDKHTQRVIGDWERVMRQVDYELRPGEYQQDTKKRLQTPMAGPKGRLPKEDVDDRPDHEISMASSELTSIAKDAANLLDIVRQRSEEEGLEAWQQSKITKAADYMNSVLQSISGDEEQGVAEEIGYDEITPKSASYILRKMEQGVPMSSILDDFPELGRRMEIIAGELGLHPDDDFEDIEASLYHELEDLAASGEDEMGEGLRDPKDNPCWKGYKPVGTKKKGGRTVPNCVPTNEDTYTENLISKLNSIVKR